ncbi:MAG: 2Fe-2S iron-sulfur cluster-binding protein [Pseudomonadota bacterium]
MSNEQQEIAEPELVKFKVDGREVAAPKGKNLLQALLDAGEDVSYFCYHRCLSVAAVCRQCMVSIGGRIVPACQNVVTDGLEVLSNSSQAVLDARRKMLEYTLVNHPLDCVMCDKAGECALQRQYMDWDTKPSLVNHNKLEKPKKVDLGPDIVLDAERCILCSRCMRFCAEIAKQPELTFCQRGDHSFLTTAPGRRLQNPYSLNTVDICPVGALTDKNFRFQARVWELFATNSVCNGCSRGCPMEIHHRKGKIYRMVPPKKWDMNLNWMCNYGRSTYEQLAENRLTAPRLNKTECTLDRALEWTAQKLKDSDRSKIGVVLGADVTNEDNFAAVRFATDVLKTGLIYLAELPDNNEGDEILRQNDPNPNRGGAKACGKGQLKTIEQLVADLKEQKLKVLYVVSDVLALPEEALQHVSSLDALIMQVSCSSPLADKAQVLLPAAKWAEVDGTITNFEGKVQRLYAAIEPPGLARPHWDLLARVTQLMETSLEFVSAGAIFGAMVEKVEKFAGANWGNELPRRQLRFAGRRG